LNNAIYDGQKIRYECLVDSVTHVYSRTVLTLLVLYKISLAQNVDTRCPDL